MGFSSEDGRQGMAFSAADMGLWYITLAFLTGGPDLNLFPEKGKRPLDRSEKDHVFAGIGL